MGKIIKVYKVVYKIPKSSRNFNITANTKISISE